MNNGSLRGCRFLSRDGLGKEGLPAGRRRLGEGTQQPPRPRSARSAFRRGADGGPTLSAQYGVELVGSCPGRGIVSAEGVACRFKSFTSAMNWNGAARAVFVAALRELMRASRNSASWCSSSSSWNCFQCTTLCRRVALCPCVPTLCPCYFWGDKDGLVIRAP